MDEWLDDLRDDAEYNLASYVDCFLSENLVRKYIENKGMVLKRKVKDEAKKWRKRESDKKGRANISFDIRKDENDIVYLGMDTLALCVEGKKDSGGKQSLWTDAVSYAPMRNVVGHTGLLTENAKLHLRLTHENIKGTSKDVSIRRRQLIYMGRTLHRDQRGLLNLFCQSAAMAHNGQSSGERG